MKILLVHPSQHTAYGDSLIKPSHPPLGLLYIASCLQKYGHKINVIDYDNDNITDDKFKSFLRKNRPDAVGFTATTSSINHAVKLAGYVKQIGDIPVMIGGIHATIAPEKVIKEKCFDFVIFGEAEQTAVELVRELCNKNKDFSNVKGIVYRKKGKAVFNEARPVIKDLDTLPFPAIGLLKNKYLPPDALKTPAISIFTSRGCPGRCTYCCTKNIFGLKLRFRSVKNMIQEIESLLGKGIREIHIMDDNFTVHKKRVLDFRDMLKKKGIETSFVFGNGLRADMIDEDILQALKDMDVLSVGFGVESGNQEILDRIKKDIKLETVEKAYKLSKKFGFQTWGFFMIGLPGETKETVRDTIDFAKKVDPDFAKFLILKPYPGSEVFEELNEKGLIFDFDYENYGVYTKPVHNLPNLSSEEIGKLHKQAFREFYLRPGKIMQHLIRLKSFTQLKLDLRSGLFVLKKIFK